MERLMFKWFPSDFNSDISFWTVKSLHKVFQIHKGFRVVVWNDWFPSRPSMFGLVGVLRPLFYFGLA